MKEIHKQWKIKGLVGKPSTFSIKKMPLLVNVTKDKKGCTLSVGSELLDMQFTIPIDEILKELER